jgi:hypothetical protein
MQTKKQQVADRRRAVEKMIDNAILEARGERDDYDQVFRDNECTNPSIERSYVACYDIDDGR